MSLFQTLHCHTTSSDGVLSHREILHTCQKYGVGIVAFTDHDTLPSVNELKELEHNRDHPTKWIIGIEYSSGLPRELGGGPSSGFHIVGLFVDPTNKPLHDHCRKAKQARIERMKKIVKNLTSLGFKITETDCLKASSGEVIARPHIVTALKKRSTNICLIEQLRIKMEKEARHNEALMKKYTAMMESGEGQYPYALFLSNDSFIPNVYAGYQYWTDMDTSVSLIRQAGGLAIVAHYFTLVSKVSLDLMDTLFKEGRLDGVETVFGLGVESSALVSQIAENRKTMKTLVNKYDLVESGGVDAHTRKDFELFSQTTDYARETIGMTEKIVKKTNISTRWSSL